MLTSGLKLPALALGLCCLPGAAAAQQGDDTPRPVVVPAPPAGRAEVVFFRAPGMLGSAISCAIQENGAKIASLPPGRFFILVANAGHHAYTTASSGDNRGIVFDLRPGDIRYVGCHIQPGLWVGKADLEIPLRDDAFATKMWKQVTPDRIASPDVLTSAQLAAALSAPRMASPPPPSPPPAPVPAPTAPGPAAAPAPVRAPVAAPVPMPATPNTEALPAATY